MTTMLTSPEATPQRVGARLGVLRRIKGRTQREFAAAAGMAPNRYNQYETGKKALSVEAAVAICLTYHVTLDWIFLGDRSGLRQSMTDLIAGLEREQDNAQ